MRTELFCKSLRTWKFSTGKFFNPDPSPHFPKKTYCKLFLENAQKSPLWRSKICNINVWIENDPSPPILKFSENSSILVAWPVPYADWHVASSLNWINSRVFYILDKMWEKLFWNIICYCCQFVVFVCRKKSSTTPWWSSDHCPFLFGKSSGCTSDRPVN